MNLALYRKFVTLNNQIKVLLRPQLKEDMDPLLDLFMNAPEEDVLFLKQNVRDKNLIKHWTEELDLNKVFPLLAFHGEKVMGNATLHFGRDSHRHSAQVRIYIRPEYRGLGLGSIMLKELIEICHKLGLKLVWAEIVLEQSKVIKAFLELGFTLNCVLKNWFVRTDGKYHDVALMLYGIGKKTELTF
jgi:L-amino acid N-acyltransferase YncA